MPQTNILSAFHQYEINAAKHREPNKAVLFDVLEAAGITSVRVLFDGCGDSGQIEDIQAQTGDAATALPTSKITIKFAVWNSGEQESHIMPIPEAIEHLAYDFLSETHSGWENSEGGYGDFLFDVAERKITLDYNERIDTTRNYTHEF